MCAEQFFIAEQARLLGDESSFHLIMEVKDPREHKRLGRKVRRFDHVTWDRERVNVAFAGNYAKISQNPDMRRCLLSTGDRLMAEASPFDPVWGIGLRADNPDASCRSRWPGQNLLGHVLQDVRQLLRDGAAAVSDPLLSPPLSPPDFSPSRIYEVNPTSRRPELPHNHFSVPLDHDD